MIIVEGPDGAGKTTLIAQIVHATGLNVANRVVSKDAQPMTDLRVWVEENLDSGWKPQIFDRHRLISEPIYGPIIRRKLEPGFEDLDWFYDMTKELYDLDPIIIYCLPPMEQVWINVREDEDNRVVAQQHVIQQIWSSYFLRSTIEHTISGLDCFRYDYTHHTAPSLREFLISHIRHQCEKRGFNVRAPERA